MIYFRVGVNAACAWLKSNFVADRGSTVPLTLAELCLASDLQAFLLVVQALGVNWGEVQRARAERDAARAEREELLNLFIRGKPIAQLNRRLLDGVLHGSPVLVRYALAEGANVEITGGEMALSALMFAAREGNVGIVRILIDAGAVLDLVNDVGWTALHFSCTAAVARVLLEAGADDAMRNDAGETALAMYERLLEEANYGVWSDANRVRYEALVAVLREYKQIDEAPDADSEARTADE